MSGDWYPRSGWHHTVDSLIILVENIHLLHDIHICIYLYIKKKHVQYTFIHVHMKFHVIFPAISIYVNQTGDPWLCSVEI